MKKTLAIFSVLLLCSLPAEGFAQCEQASTATTSMIKLLTDDIKNITDYATQEINFTIEKLSNTATNELKARLDEFDGNVRVALAAWSDRLIPALKKMTGQLSIAQIDQTRVIGSMMDAQLLNTTIKNRNERLSAARQRHSASELSCQADTAGPGQTKAYQMSRALARTFPVEANPRMSNATGTASATGSIAELKPLWEEYVTKFCDPGSGDQGCTAAGTLAGKNRDIPGILWGDRQTIDMSNPDNRLMVEAALRNMIHPLSEDPIPPGATNSAEGRQALLDRRAEMARLNTVYNVMGQMIAERVGGSGLNTQLMRAKAGVPATEASTDASYREIQQTMTKDVFYDPSFIVRLIGHPAQVIRAQLSIKAAQLQLMNDIYHRSEEMLFMEAAVYGQDLDKQAPSSAVSSAPLR